MLTIVLISLVILLSIGLGYALYYLFRFVRIIMAIEDTLANGLETFERTQASLEELLKMQMFFESKEVQYTVKSALADVNLCKTDVVKVINDFTRLSKQQYEMVRVDEDIDTATEENL